MFYSNTSKLIQPPNMTLMLSILYPISTFLIYVLILHLVYFNILSTCYDHMVCPHPHHSMDTRNMDARFVRIQAYVAGV